MREWAGGGGVALRCAILGQDSMERSQLSDIDNGGGGCGCRGEQSILEFRGIGRERRCEGHQSGEGERERERAHSSVGRSDGRSEKGRREEEERLFHGWISVREREREREHNGKRKVAAVSRFDCAMFSDSSRVD